MNVSLKTSYIIATTGRNGSTLLADALTQTELAGKPTEYFLPNMVFNAVRAYHMSITSLPDYAAQLIEKTATPNGVFGTKMMWLHLDSFVTRVLDSEPDYHDLNTFQRFERLFHHPRYIFMRRRDHVRQGISMLKALQSDVWFVHREGELAHQPRPMAELRFDYYALEHEIEQAREGEQRWENFFAEHGVMPHSVYYEELDTAYEPTVNAVLDFLEIERPDGFSIAPPRLVKQSDHINDEWAALYQHMLEEKSAPPPPPPPPIEPVAPEPPLLERAWSHLRLRGKRA